MWATAAIAVVVAIYVGSAAASLAGLADAVRKGFASDILSRTDLDSLKRSLVHQLVGAYLENIGQKRPITSRDRMLVSTVGASIADAVISDILTPTNLTALLRDGRIAGNADRPEIKVSALSAFSLREIDFSRVRVVKPTEFAVELGDGANRYGIRMQMAGPITWKLSAVDLPQNLLKTMAERLPR